VKLQKQLSRRVEGKNYPKYVVTISPKQIEELGWKEGEFLESEIIDQELIIRRENKEDLEKSFLALKDYQPTSIENKVQKLDRNAVVGGVEHPAYVRSHCFETSIGGLPVRIQSDIQYRINNWDWGDKLEFIPEHTYIVNKKTALVPILVKYNLYQGLGWTDRMEKIKRMLQLQERQRP
jgi:bifunctional DNA-binding transcriptional regulator/antitoxin component of YhaV-PrlF toxin-antitoxin module